MWSHGGGLSGPTAVTDSWGERGGDAVGDALAEAVAQSCGPSAMSAVVEGGGAWRRWTRQVRLKLLLALQGLRVILRP